MGTRSLTFVYDEDTPLINMYRQYDGYPSGHGAELADFLNKSKYSISGLCESPIGIALGFFQIKTLKE